MKPVPYIAHTNIKLCAFGIAVEMFLEAPASHTKVLGLSSVFSTFFFFKTECLFETVTKGKRESKKAWILWLAPQVTAMTRAGLNQRQEPGASFMSPTHGYRDPNT